MNNVGIIFTSLVSFLISASAFVAGFWALQKRKNIDRAVFSYSLFLMLTAGLWFFAGLELFASRLGRSDLAKVFFVADQLFLFLSGIALAYYLALKMFKKEWLAKIFAFVYSFVLFLEIIFLFKFGVIKGESTYFAEKFQLNKFSFLLFVLIIIPLLAGSFFNFLSKGIKWILKRKTEDLYQFFYSFIVAVYLLGGIFDEAGFIADWKLVFFRLIFLAAFLTACLVFRFQRLKEENLIEGL
jgi:uncharacterized membrane protein